MKKAKKMTSVDIAQEYIKKLIIDGQYNENGFLPSEGQLAKDLELSRATVREAVRSLEVRGFLSRIHGKGLKIVDNSINVVSMSISDMIAKQSNVLEDLFEIRRLLEPYGAERAAKLRSTADLKELNDYLFLMETAEKMDDAYYTADLNFHIKLAQISQNQVFASLVNAYSNVMEDLIIIHSQDVSPIEQRFHYHRKIYFAIKERDGEKARDAMTEHLRAAQGNKIFRAANN
ncbi:FadR/GntR family transcriptional regulator [Candidatus Epulonipiscium viviparus]|uniref:FadR/GntR family transcriptional regulator n=1 Tax=Candidatus Epulonipiscium viviparus TaxID=420336 RepID=UPI00016C0A02|nr:FadR/GntR family transcriptional regulator [Candidatus Epulopiscium viviparus]